MKISFDINGVIDKYPTEIFGMMNVFKRTGHEVGIATGNSLEALPPEWIKQFDFIITCNGPEEELRFSDFPATDDMEKMVNWKVPRLLEENVDVHFDDYADEMNILAENAPRPITIIKIK